MFLKVKGGKVQSSRQGRFGARSECGHQPNSPARPSSLQSEGAQHHCVTRVVDVTSVFVSVSGDRNGRRRVFSHSYTEFPRSVIARGGREAFDWPWITSLSQ